MILKSYILKSEFIREGMIAFIRQLPISEDNPWTITIRDTVRTYEQNALLWPLLNCFEDQKLWPDFDGELVKVDSETWKDILTAAFKGESIKFVRGLRGGFVMAGLRTSKMGKKEFSEFIEFIYAEGTNLGINFEQKRAAA